MKPNQLTVMHDYVKTRGEAIKKQGERIAEIHAARDKEISEATKPQIEPTDTGLSLADLADTTEANRQEHGEIRQKLYALKSLINCLWP